VDCARILESLDRFAAVTDVGMRRSNNQDAHTLRSQADSLERFTARGHLFVVADGMGAHAAGELASRIAAEQIPLYYLRKPTGDPISALA
jgi:PPM family protein phosphatase